MGLSNKTKDILSLFTETKISILKNLYLCQNEMCGCDLVEKLTVPKNLLSYHLKSLRQIGLVEEKRCGKNKKYRIVKSEKLRVKRILEIVELI